MHVCLNLEIHGGSVYVEGSYFSIIMDTFILFSLASHGRFKRKFCCIVETALCAL